MRARLGILQFLVGARLTLDEASTGPGGEVYDQADDAGAEHQDHPNHGVIHASRLRVPGDPNQQKNAEDYKTNTNNNKYYAKARAARRARRRTIVVPLKSGGGNNRERSTRRRRPDRGGSAGTFLQAFGDGHNGFTEPAAFEFLEGVCRTGGLQPATHESVGVGMNPVLIKLDGHNRRPAESGREASGKYSAVPDRGGGERHGKDQVSPPETVPIPHSRRPPGLVLKASRLIQCSLRSKQPARSHQRNNFFESVNLCGLY
jgi:hypothetical protein